MVDNSQVTYDFDVDGSQAQREMQKLRQEIKAFSVEMDQAQKRLASALNQNTNAYVKKYRELTREIQVASAKNDEALIARLQQKIERLERLERGDRQRIQNSIASGSPDSVNRRASQSFVVQNAASTQQALTNKFNLEMGKLAKEAMKALPEQINAEFKKAMFRAQQLIENTTPSALRNDTILAARSRQKKSLAANAGDVYFAAEDKAILERQQNLIRRQNESDVLRAARETARIDKEIALIKRQTEGSELREAREMRRIRAEEKLLRDKNESPAIRDARLLRQSRSDQFLLRQAEIGENAASNERTRSRLTDPSFIGIQTGLMANYMVLNQAFTALTAVSGAVVQLETDFAQLQAITNATDGDMVKLKDSVFDLGNRTRFANTEIAQAAVVLGQAGLSAQQTGKALEGVALLATAAGTDMASATDILTSTLTIFDIQAENTAHVAQILTGALNSSKLDIQKLALGLQYAGNIAASSSIPLEELVSILGALADSGVRGSTAGTGVRQLLLDLSTPSEKLLANLKRLGLTVADIDIKTNGFVGVLNNLRRAGFTTGDALESFEVRASAAYTALQNNVSAINTMRQSLTLTSAATDAAAIQMDTLTSAGNRLVNTMTSVAFQAFRPLNEIFKTLLNGLSNFLQGLSQMRGLLEAVGIVIGTAIAVKTTVYVSSLVGGFFGLSELMAVLPARLALARAGMLGLASSTSIASGATLAFGAALNFLKANPVLLAITAIASVVGALTIWKSMQTDVTSAIDDTRTAIGLQEEQINSTTQSMEAISNAVHDLTLNSQALEKDRALGGGMIRTRVLELKTAFGELGFELKNSVNPTVAELIDSLNRLRADLGAKLPSFIEAKLAEMETQMQQIQSQLDVARQASNLPESVQTFLRSNVRMNRAAGIGAGTSGYAKADALTRSAVDLLTGKTPLPADSADMFGIIGQITRRANGATDPDQKQLFTDIATALKSLQDTLNKRGQVELDSASGRRELLNAQVAINTGSIGNALSGIEGQSLAGTSAALRASGSDPIRLKENMKALREEVFAQLKPLEDELERQRQELVNSGVTEEGAESALLSTGLPTKIEEIKAGLTRAVEGKTKEISAILKELNKQSRTSNARELSRLNEQLRSAKSAEEVKQIEELFRAAYDRKRQIEREAFGLDNPDTATLPENILAQKAAQSDINLDEQQSQKEIEDRMKAIGQSANDLAINVLEAQADEIKKEIERLKSSYNGKTPISTIRAIFEQMNTLAGQLFGIYDEIGMIKKSSLAPKTSGRTYGANASTVQKMIIAAANARGIDPKIALALAGSESGFDVNARPEGSTASGLFQVTDGTYGDLGYGANDPRRGTASGQISAGLSYMAKAKAYFEARTGRSMQANDYKFAHVLGNNGYQRALQNMDGNAVDVLGSDAVMNNGGSEADSVRGFMARLQASFESHLVAADKLLIDSVDTAAEEVNQSISADKADMKGKLEDARRDINEAQLKASVRDLKKMADSTEQEVSTLVSQSRTLDRPDSIKKVIARVREKFAEIMELELAAFDKENADGDPEARAALIKQINERRNGVLSGLQTRYLDRGVADTNKPVTSLERQLGIANDSGNNVLSEILGKDVKSAKIEAAKKRVVFLLNEQASAQTALNNATRQYGAQSSEVTFATNQLADVTERLNDAQREQSDLVGDTTARQIDQAAVINQTTQAWMKQQGVIYDANGAVDESATKTNQLASAWSDVLNGMSGAFTQLYTDLAEGNKTLADTFKDFGKTVLKVFQDIFIKMAVMKTMQALFGGDAGGGLFGGAGGGLGSLFGGLFGKGMAAGGVVRGGIPNRDSVPRTLMPGEGVLTASAMSILGENKLAELNNLGNRRLSKEGVPSIDYSKMGQGGGGQVSVWVVQPDQIPPPGPNDIIAHVASNIQNRGSLKTLIKQVSMGAI